MRFVGYPLGVKAYRVRDVVAGQFFDSRDVVFDENVHALPFEVTSTGGPSQPSPATDGDSDSDEDSRPPSPSPPPSQPAVSLPSTVGQLHYLCSSCSFTSFWQGQGPN